MLRPLNRDSQPMRQHNTSSSHTSLPYIIIHLTHEPVENLWSKCPTMIHHLDPNIPLIVTREATQTMKKSTIWPFPINAVHMFPLPSQTTHNDHHLHLHQLWTSSRYWWLEIGKRSRQWYLDLICIMFRHWRKSLIKILPSIS